MRPCVINPIPQKSADKRIPPRPTRAERIIAFKEPVTVCNDVEGSDKVPCPSLKVAELEWSVDCTESLELLNVEVSLVALRKVFEAALETTTSTAAAAVVPQYASIGLVVTPAVKYTSYDSYAAVPFDVILGRLDKDAVMANPSDATTTLVRQQYEGPVTVRVTISIHNCTFTGGEGQMKELLARVGGSEMGAVSVRLTQGEMPKATQWRPIIYRRWFEVKDVPNSTSNNGGGEAAASGDNCAQFEASVAYPPTNPFYREHRAKQAHARLKRLAGAAAAAGAAEAAAVMAAEEESEDGGLIPLTKAEKKKMAKKEKKGSKSANNASAEKEEDDELRPPVLVAPAVPTTPFLPTPPTSTSSKFRLLAGSVVEARAVSTCGKFVRWARPSTLTKSQIANYLPTSEDTSSRRNGARQEPASTLTAAGRVVVYDTPSSSSPPHFAGIDYEVIGGGETPMHQVKMYTRRLVAPTHREATLLHTPSSLDCRSTFLYPHTGATQLTPLSQGEAREAIALVPCGQHLFVQWADAANDGQLSKMAQKGTIRNSSTPSSHIGLVHAYNGTHLATSNYFAAEGESKLMRSAKKGGAKVVPAKSIDAEKEEVDAPDLIAADVIPTEQDPHWVCGPEALGHSWSVVATVGWQPASTASVETLGEVHHSVPAPTPATTTTAATAARVEGESSETIVTSKPLTDEQAAAACVPPSSGDSSSSPPPPQLVEYYIGQRLHRTIAFFAPSSLLINEPTITLRSDWPSHIGSTANSQKMKQVTIPRVGDLRVGAAETDVKNTVHLNQVSAFLKACQDMHEHDPRSNNSRRFRFFRGAVKDVMIPRTDVPTATKDEWSSRRLMDWNEIRAAVAVHIGSVRSTGFDLEAHLASQEMSEGSTNDSKGDEEDAAVASKSARGSEVVGSAGTQRGTSPSPRDNTTSSADTAAASNHSSTATTGQQNGLETGVVFVQWADGTFSCASSPAGLHLVEVNPVRPEDVQFTSPLPLTPEDIASPLDGEDALHTAVRTDRVGVLRTPMMVRRSTSPDVIDISVQESTRNRKREETKERRNAKKQRAAGGGSHGSPNSSKSGKGQHRKQDRPYYDHGEDDEEGGSYSDDEYGDSYDEEGGHDGEEEGSSDFDSEEDEDSDVSSTFSMRREREAEKGGIIDPSLMPASMREKLRSNTIPMSDLPQIDLGDNKKHKKGGGKKHHHHHDGDSEEEWESEGEDNHAYDYGGGSMDGDSYDDDEDYDSDDEEDDSAFETTQTSAGDMQSGEGEEGDSLVGSSAFDTEYDYDSGYNSSDMYCDEDTNEFKNYKNGQLSDEAYSYEEGWSTESADEGESEGDDDQQAANTPVGKKRARGATTNTPPPTTKKGGKKSSGASATTEQPMSVRGRKLEPSPPQSKKKSTKVDPAVIPTKVLKATAAKGSSTKKSAAAASSSTPLSSSSSQATSTKGGATKKDGVAKKDKKDTKKKKK